MNARVTPPEGWVTVAEAAKRLTEAGDPIDASNVSRYLARFPDLPQERIGKFRWLDLVELARHRRTNVLVGEKQAARDVVAPELALRPSRIAVEDDDDDLEEPASAGRAPSELNQANVTLKNLKIREAQLDLDEREGRLIPAPEVFALLSGVMQTLLGELEREETALAASHGREVSAAVRRGRKAAQASASRKLMELARKHLPAHLAPAIGAAMPAETAEAA